MEVDGHEEQDGQTGQYDLDPASSSGKRRLHWKIRVVSGIKTSWSPGRSDITINRGIPVGTARRVGLSPQPVRSYLVIAAAIIIAGVLISASLFFVVGQGTKTVTVTGNAATNSAGPTNTVTSTTTIGFSKFLYTMWAQSTPNSFTLDTVKFTLWTNTTITFSAGSCYGPSNGYAGYVITFSDGSSQTLTTCTIGVNPPPLSVVLTSHTNPQAGILIVPSTGQVYFLVSLTS